MASNTDDDGNGSQMRPMVATFSAEERTECGVLLENKTVEDEPDQNVELDFRDVENRNRSRRRIKFSILELVFMIVILLLFIVLVGLLSKIASLSSDNSTEISDVCVSRGCIETASRVAASLNEKIDPCEDFYEFACGGWKNKNPLPSGHARWTTFDVLHRENQAIMKTLLEANVSTATPTEKKAMRLFNTCLDEKKINEIGSKPLLDMINKLGGWDILGTWNESQFNFNNSLKELSRYSQSPFFSFGIGADAKQSDRRVLQIGAESLTAGSRDFYLNKTITEDKILSGYLNYMTTIATLLGGDKNTSRSRMLEVLELEQRIAAILPTLQERRDDANNYHKLTIGSLKDLAPSVDWDDVIPDLFHSVANITITSDEPVVVSSLNYFKNFSNIVFSTNKRTLHNYLMWGFVRTFVSILGDDFQKAINEIGKIISGADWNCLERWRMCVGVVDGVVGQQLGKMYVEKQFRPSSRESALKMVSAIKSSFHNNLDSLPWMDKETQKKAAEKVDAVTELIGFSDKILNDTYLEKEYEKLLLPEGGSYFDYEVGILKYYLHKHLSQLRKPVDKYRWPVTPSTVNAFYTPTKNVVVFPGGILQPPFYDTNAPQSMNFGGIGIVVGHELTHGFDDQGALYDLNGNLNKWWNDKTYEKFKNKTDCMAKQYNKYKVKDLAVNGNVTVGENIADNGGFKLSYKAYQAWRLNNSDFMIPSLNYTQDQLFHIAFAQIWCSEQTYEDLGSSILSNVHAPSSARVRGVINNSPHFGKAFNCPVGSPMNPKEKCEVW